MAQIYRERTLNIFIGAVVLFVLVLLPNKVDRKDFWHSNLHRKLPPERGEIELTANRIRITLVYIKQ